MRCGLHGLPLPAENCGDGADAGSPATARGDSCWGPANTRATTTGTTTGKAPIGCKGFTPRRTVAARGLVNPRTDTGNEGTRPVPWKQSAKANSVPVTAVCASPATLPRGATARWAWSRASLTPLRGPAPAVPCAPGLSRPTYGWWAAPDNRQWTAPMFNAADTQACRHHAPRHGTLAVASSTELSGSAGTVGFRSCRPDAGGSVVTRKALTRIRDTSAVGPPTSPPSAICQGSGSCARTGQAAQGRDRQCTSTHDTISDEPGVRRNAERPWLPVVPRGGNPRGRRVGKALARDLASV
ncbi:hypothetical protein GZL_09116 [Streptomyces sp. 769]|nr:hypothetical protein GZL_09116 [Streptomyces sp. 769]